MCIAHTLTLLLSQYLSRRKLKKRVLTLKKIDAGRKSDACVDDKPPQYVD